MKVYILTYKADEVDGEAYGPGGADVLCVNASVTGFAVYADRAPAEQQLRNLSACHDDVAYEITEVTL